MEVGDICPITGHGYASPLYHAESEIPNFDPNSAHTGIVNAACTAVHRHDGTSR